MRITQYCINVVAFNAVRRLGAACASRATREAREESAGSPRSLHFGSKLARRGFLGEGTRHGFGPVAHETHDPHESHEDRPLGKACRAFQPILKRFRIFAGGPCGSWLPSDTRQFDGKWLAGSAQSFEEALYPLRSCSAVRRSVLAAAPGQKQCEREPLVPVVL